MLSGIVDKATIQFKLRCSFPSCSRSYQGSGSSALPLSSLFRTLFAAVFSVLLVLCHVQARDMRVHLTELSLVVVILVALR